MAADQESANRNIRLAGGFLIGVGVFSVLAAFMAIMVFSLVMSDDFAGGNSPDGFRQGVSGMMTIMFLLHAIMGGLTIWGGVGMMQGAPWGKTMGYVAAAIQLINIPFGTAAGIFALIVLGDTLADGHFEENNAIA